VSKQVIVLIFSSAIVLFALYGLVGFNDFAHTAPKDAAIVVELHRPLELADKLLNSDIYARLFPPAAVPLKSAPKKAPLAEAMPADPLSAYPQRWRDLGDYSFARAAIQFAMKSCRFVLTPTLGPAEKPVLTPAFFVDGGFLARLAGHLMPSGFLPAPKSFDHHGRRIFVVDEFAFAFFDNYVVLGLTDDVRATVEAIVAGRLAKGENRDRYRRALALADKHADAAAIFLDDSLFRPAPNVAHGFDPRAFFPGGAVDLAVANVWLKEDGPRVRLVLSPYPGKMVNPLTITAPGEFLTRPLASDNVAVYVAARLERPAELSALLLDLLADSDEMKSLRKKLAMMMLDTFFGYTGHEFAIVLDSASAEPGNFPVCVFQLSKEHDMLDLLAKMSKSGDEAAEVLSLPLGPEGKPLSEAIDDLKDDAKLAELLAKVPADHRAALESIARRVRAGQAPLAAVERQAHRVNMFGRDWHWRITKSMLILATSAELADRYQNKLEHYSPPPLLQNDSPYVPIDGPFLAEASLAALLGKTAAGGPAANFIELAPRLVVGGKYTRSRLTIFGAIPVRLGLANVYDGGLFWLSLLYGSRGLLLAVALACLALAVRAAYLLSGRGTMKHRW